MSTLHGPTFETRRANRRNGPMHWTAAQFRTVGPFVFIRELKRETAGAWELIAVALDPARYVKATAGKLDVTR